MFEFSILLLEDVPDTLDQLQKLIRGSFPNDTVWIDAAETVDDAIGQIDQAAAERRTYDLAILDCKVPKARGSNPEIDEQVCLRLSGVMPRTVICHMSGFDDQAIKSHNEKYHPPERSRGFFINKTGKLNEWAPNLLGKLPQMLYGMDLERRIESLFRSRDAGQIFVGRAAARSGSSLTNRIIDLRLDIGQTWNQLSEPTKAYIQCYFLVRQGVPDFPNNVAIDLL